MGRKYLRGFACCIAEHVAWRTPHLVSILQTSPTHLATFDFLACTLQPAWAAVYRNTRVLESTHVRVHRWMSSGRVPALTRCTATLRRMPITERPSQPLIDGFGRSYPAQPCVEVRAELVDERGVAFVATEYVQSSVDWVTEWADMTARGAPIHLARQSKSGHDWPEWIADEDVIASQIQPAR